MHAIIREGHRKEGRTARAATWDYLSGNQPQMPSFALKFVSLGQKPGLFHWTL